MLPKLDTKDKFVFVIGLFAMIKFRILGTFALSELIVFASYFFIPQIYTIKYPRKVINFILMASLWLMGVIISDLFNNTNIENSLKGSFNVVFIILAIPFVYWSLYDKPRRMLYYWLGAGLSEVLSFYFQRVEGYNEFEADVWRVYAYYPLFVALSGYIYFKGKHLLACITIECFAVWSLFHMSRNVFLSMTLGVTVVFFIDYILKRYKENSQAVFRKKLVRLAVILGVAMLGVVTTYEYLAQNKILGESAYKKYMIQKNKDRGLASGRNDFFESFDMAIKSPAFGYGSYARWNNINYSNTASRHMDYPFNKEDEMIPGHSYLMGAWTYSGILGLIFWIYVLYEMIKFVNNALIYDKKLIGINVLMSFMMFWNIMFSPFSDRLNLVYYMVLILILQLQYYKFRHKI